MEIFTKLLVVDKECEIECTSMRILSNTELQCQYNGIGLAGTCSNKSILVRTEFDGDTRESNRVELCYDEDRGELENVPLVEQNRKESDVLTYAISLTPEVVPKAVVQIRIFSTTYDSTGLKIEDMQGYGCTVSPTTIFIDRDNSNTTHPITVSAEDNDIDEGTLQATAYKCEILHTIETLDSQYNQSAAKLLRVRVKNDDLADLKLQVKELDDFDPEKVKSIGPMCLTEISNLTYGVTLSARPTRNVSVHYQLKRSNDSPLRFIFDPNLPIVFQPHEWDRTKSFTIMVKEDSIDNHKDIDSISINHWVLTDDAVFQNNSKMVTAKFRIMDDDTAGIDISPDSMSLVLNAGESQRITINQLSSEPISEVTLCLLNMNNIEGIKLSGCTVCNRKIGKRKAI